jgi:hypothetical protein
MPNPPLLLVDNVFDAVNLYAGAVITADNEAVGHEAFRVGDYRRDRTWWQATTTSGVRSLIAQLPSAAAVDYVFWDRGHNLGGVNFSVEGGNDGVNFPDSVAFVLPTTVGGVPTGGTMCQTEEGAAYALFTALPAHTYWRVRFTSPGVIYPAIPGLMLGLRTQLLGYSKTFDEDAGGRTQPSTQSTAGYRANDRTYSWRTVALELDLIGATEYDGKIRALRSTLFDKNQPFVCAMDYGTHPERAWMYTYDGTSWGMPKSRVYRSGRLVAREHMPRLL